MSAHPNYFGNALNRARTDRNVSIEQLSLGSRVPVRALTRFEAGKQRPCIVTLRRICLALNVSADELLSITLEKSDV